VYSLNDSNHRPYHTTGQVAKSLRVSVSTLKRWLEENPSLAGFRTNASGWRLFSPDEIENLREHQRRRKREGKTFRPDTLRPVNDE
jgi:DNA-binding transcriptional MerR regulator